MTYKKFICITKVGGDVWLKHHVNNMLSFVAYLDKNHPDWKFINCYSDQHERFGERIANYTKYKRPLFRYIYLP